MNRFVSRRRVSSAGARCSDEGCTVARTPGEIFGVARLLAHQHQLGLTRAFAEDGLRAALPQVACLTRLRGVADVREARPIRDQLSGGLRWLRHCAVRS